MFTRKRVIAFTASVMVMSVVGPSQAAQISPVKIFGGRTDQFLPGANANYIEWSHNEPTSPAHYDAYAQSLVAGVPTGAAMKLNTGASNGFPGSIRPDANEAVFQQVNGRRTRSDLFLVDLDISPLARIAPTGLNTSNWEWQPVISKDWILFARTNRRNTRNGIYLYDRSTLVTIELASAKILRNGNVRLWPDDVTQMYATWTASGSAGLTVYYYNLSTKIKSAVPSPNTSNYYSSSVSDATGDMYFAHSGKGCGVRVEIFRWHIGDPPPYTAVSSLPAGYDVAYKTATFYDGVHDSVYFDRLRCGGKYYSDIYEVPAADTAS